MAITDKGISLDLGRIQCSLTVLSDIVKSTTLRPLGGGNDR